MFIAQIGIFMIMLGSLDYTRRYLKEDFALYLPEDDLGFS